MTSLAVIILTNNESRHLERAIASVSSFATSIHVIDSGSTDDTTAIARRNGAEVLHHPWVNYASQFQWAADTIASDAEWIMRLDADETVEPDLARRIREQLPVLPADVVGINIDRKHIFLGRWIRYGGRYPLTLLRIYRRGHGRIEQRWMDEHLIVHGGRTVHFAGGFTDHNLGDLAFFIAKHNGYATREAIDVLNQRHDLFSRDIEITAARASPQAALKRWVKEQVYNRLPFYLSAPAYFLYRYLFQLGFLDGRQGLIYHVLQGFWYRFLVGARVVELEAALHLCPDRPAKLVTLANLTGLQLLPPTHGAAPPRQLLSSDA